MAQTSKNKLASKPMSLGAITPIKKPRLVHQLNQKLEVPAFSTTYPEWAGASYVVARALIQMGFLWSFRVPVTPPNDTFVACIKWTEPGNVVRRYKLWSDIGEVLSYPLYVGELIPAANAVLEIWNVEGELTAELTETWTPEITMLEMPADCCDVDSTLYSLDALCLTLDPTIADNYLNNLDEYFEKCPIS